MSQVTVEQLKDRLAHFAERKKYFEFKCDTTAEKLVQHEVWRHAYTSFPYLIGAPSESLASRFRDIFVNLAELGIEGKIGVRPGFVEDHTLTEKFTHILEEWGSRGGIPDKVIQSAKVPIHRYFENGDPIAVKMFKGYVAPNNPFLVKYGRGEFLEPMYKKGEIRICPASYYCDDTLLDSIKDNETARTFFIPTFRERLSGQTATEFQGRTIRFGDDDIEVSRRMSDYYLYSLCDQIYYRLPTDFKADAVLVIHEPSLFAQRLISTFLARHPEWEPRYGPVTYYDPYRDYTKAAVPEMSKHFGYSYQREVRIAFTAKRTIHSTLQPEFLCIGSMLNYAELIRL